MIVPALPDTTVEYDPPLYWTAISNLTSVPKISPLSLRDCKEGTVIVNETASTLESVIWITLGVACGTVENPVDFVVSTFFVIGIFVWLDVPVLASKVTSLKLKLPSADCNGVLFKNIDFAPSTNPCISPSLIRSNTFANC